MGVAVARVLPNLLGSLAVLAVAAVLAYGLPAVDAALPAQRPVPVGEPYEVGAGVVLTPPAGALLDLAHTRPRTDRGAVLFLLGDVRFAVTVEPFDGTVADAARRLRRKITSERGFQVTGPEVPAATGSALLGVSGGYTAPRRAGRYCVFVAAGLVIELTVSGADAELRATLPRIEASVRSVRVRGDP